MTDLRQENQFLTGEVMDTVHTLVVFMHDNVNELTRELGALKRLEGALRALKNWESLSDNDREYWRLIIDEVL